MSSSKQPPASIAFSLAILFCLDEKRDSSLTPILFLIDVDRLKLATAQQL